MSTKFALILAAVFSLINSSLGLKGQSIPKSEAAPMFFIKTAPLSLLDPAGKNFRLGIDYKITEHFGIAHDFGIYIPIPSRRYPIMLNNRGFLTRTEFKFWMIKKEQSIYFSTELFYKHQTFETSQLLWVSFPDSSYVKDYTVDKRVGCFNIKTGALILGKRRFLLEVSTGLGVRYKIAKNTLSNEQYERLQWVSASQSFQNRKGKFIYPNACFDIKIGYRIK